MRATYLILFTILIFSSCVQQEDELIVKNEKPKISKLQELDYYNARGTMGDSVTGVVGFGYDITGFIDSTSVKAKVVEHLPYFQKSYPRSSEWSSSNFGYNYVDFTNRLNKYDDIHRITQKFNFLSMFKQAYSNEIIDLNSIIVYNSSISVEKAMSCSPYYTFVSATESFKKDLIELDAQRIVQKYGTHIIESYTCGQRFDFLYVIGTDKFNPNIDIDKYINFKVNDLLEAKNSITQIKTGYELAKEIYIFNYSGTQNKCFGLVNIGEENVSTIQSFFENASYSNDNNISQINQLKPIFNFIEDEDKKLEVKRYVEDYMQKAVAIARR